MAGASAQETQRVSRPGAILFGAISANKYSPSPWPHRRIGRARDDCAAASAEYAARKSNASIAPSLIQRAIMRRIISLLPHEEGEFLVRLGVGQQLVPGLPGKALEILDRAGIGGEHLEDLPGLHAAQRLLGAQNRQRAIQAARVEFQVKTHKVLCRMDKPRPQAAAGEPQGNERSSLHARCARWLTARSRNVSSARTHAMSPASRGRRSSIRSRSAWRQVASRASRTASST